MTSLRLSFRLALSHSTRCQVCFSIESSEHCHSKIKYAYASHVTRLLTIAELWILQKVGIIYSVSKLFSFLCVSSNMQLEKECLFLRNTSLKCSVGFPHLG